MVITYIVSICVTVAALLLFAYSLPVYSPSNRPPQLPYAIPFAGHLFSFYSNPIAFLQKAAESSLHGICSIRPGLPTITVISSPTLIHQLETRHAKKLDSLTAIASSLNNVWGLTTFKCREAAHMLSRVLNDLQSDWTGRWPEIIDLVFKNMQHHILNFITFSESPIDQEYWERIAETTLVDKQTVETSLFALVQSFLTYATTDALLSPDFLEQQDALGPLILAFQSELEALYFKPKLQLLRSSSVVRHLYSYVQPFLEAVFTLGRKAPGLVYEDVDEQHSLFLDILMSKTSGIQKANHSVQDAIFLYIVTLSILPHATVPWALIQVLDMTSSSVRHQVSVNGVWEEPHTGGCEPPLKLDIKYDKPHPKIRDAVAQSIKKYARGLTEYTVHEPFILIKHGKDAKSPAWNLEQGDKLLAAHWVHSVQTKTPTGEGAIEEALKQLGSFHLSTLSELYAKLYPGFIAALLRMYEITPLPGQTKVQIPRAKFGLGVALPQSDVRVRIKRRTIPNHEESPEEIAGFVVDGWLKR